MKTTAFDDYLEALEAHQKGDDEKAAQKVAKSFGSDRVSPAFASAMKNVFKRDTLLHQSIVRAMAGEQRKRDKQ